MKRMSVTAVMQRTRAGTVCVCSVVWFDAVGWVLAISRFALRHPREQGRRLTPRVV